MKIDKEFILKNLNIEILGKNKKEKLCNTINAYYRIIEIEKQKLEQKDIRQAIREFREEFKEYNLSDIKILDYILWNNR